jgi:hypothetical protein
MCLVLFSFFSESLMAIPAFARKHRLSCKTCHAPFPRLKPYGEEFAANGFVLKDKPSPRYFVDTGDDKLSLMRSFPFAVRMDAFVTHNNSKTENTDFSSPYNIKLLSGGSLAKNISYYFYFFFSERGKVVGLEDAFLMFGNVFKTGIDFTIGQFQVSDPLFKRELRLTFEDYQIYKVKPGMSNINLAYDRGIILSYTIPKGPDLVVEILNGSGIEEANVFRNFDNDKYKNIFGRISQDFGDHFRVGAFGYTGKEEMAGAVNTVWMWGGDTTISIGDFECNVQYVEREDDDPTFFTVPAIADIRTRGGLVELIYTPGGDDTTWFVVGLYNWVDSDLQELKYESAAFHVGYLVRRNIRLMAEVNYIPKSIFGKYTRAMVGLIAGF